MIEILPSLNKKDEKAMYIQLYEYIKKEIENTKLKKGERLPSIRALATKIGVSVTTIKFAYEQLVIEGFIENKEKSGYYVKDINASKKEYKVQKSKNQKIKKEEQKNYFEIYDEECFDFLKWKKCLNYVLNYQKKELLSDIDIQGECGLRNQIANYVFQARGVHCDVEDIIIGAGTQQLMTIIAVILKKCNLKSIGFEDPGYNMSRNIFLNHNFTNHNLEIDKDGIIYDPQKFKNLDTIYISPSHQFPTGIVTSISRRKKIIKWANENKKYIIEDDYDSELRYYGRPIPALKSNEELDNIIYIGSFASTLLSSIKISYLILPSKLLKEYKKIKNNYSQGVSKLEQLTLEKFIKEGFYQKHIKKIRKLYSEKANKITNHIFKNYKNKINVVSDTSGLFLVLEINSNKTEEYLADIFREEGIKATPYKNYLSEEKIKDEKHTPKILIYFYNVKTEKIIEIIDKIAKEKLQS